MNQTWTISSPFFYTFVNPLELPKWQIASASNAILAWALFFIADYAHVQHERDRQYSANKFTEATIRVIWIVGAILSLYTTSVLIYNAFTLEWGYVPIGEKWFPWQ